MSKLVEPVAGTSLKAKLLNGLHFIFALLWDLKILIGLWVFAMVMAWMAGPYKH
jgi:hypothetical protein